MKKKVISTLLAVTMLFSIMSLSVGAFNDVGEGKVAEAINKMAGLDILKGYEDGTFKPDDNVKRSEFVAIINRALGISDLVKGDVSDSPFTDVAKNHWAAGDIKFAVSKGLISGYGNNLFGPEDNVTYEQAFKIIFNAIGYEYIAGTKGEYPNNYIMLAGEQGITRGINIKFTDNATRGNISYILYEAMQLYIYEDSKIGSGELSYEKTDKTLLSELLRLKEKDIIEGTIIENHLTGLKNQTTLEKGQVKIDVKDKGERTFKVGNTNAADLIGQYVEIQIKSDESTILPEITSCNVKNTKFFEIEAEDIVNVTEINNSFKIEYEEKDNSTKTVTLDENPSFVYNGRAITPPTKNDLYIKNGKIKLIENNKNSSYDVAMIEEFYSFRVEKVSTGSSVISLKDETLNGLNRINLNTENDEDLYYSIKNDMDELIEIKDIKPDDVITVSSDKDLKNINIIVSKKTIKGIATYYNGEDKLVTIDEKDYKIGINDNNTILVTPNISKSGTFYLDCYNQIVAFEEGETLIENVAYVYKKSYKAQTGGDKFFVKLLRGGNGKKEIDKNDNPYYTTGNKDIVTYTLSDNVRFGGFKQSFSHIDSNMPEGSLINFGVNKDGLIASIDLLTPEFTKDKAAFNGEIASFGGGFYMDDKTALICVPTKQHLSDPEPVEEDFFVKVTLNSSTALDAMGFEIDPKTKIAKYAVIKTSMKSDVSGVITADEDIFILTERFEKLIDSQPHCILEGMQGGEKKTLTVKNDSRVYTQVASLKKGDVVYYSTNSQGLIDNVEYIESIIGSDTYYHKDKRGKNERAFGKLYKIQRDELISTTNKQQSLFTLNIAPDEDATIEDIQFFVDTKDMPAVYSVNAITGKISVTSLEDLYSVEEVGYDNATEIMIVMNDFTIKGIIAIKR